MIQLDFFYSESETLKEEFRKLKESQDKIRKSLFAKHGELAKNYLELLSRIESLETCISKKTYANQQIFWGEFELQSHKKQEEHYESQQII